MLIELEESSGDDRGRDMKLGRFSLFSRGTWSMLWEERGGLGDGHSSRGELGDAHREIERG